MSLLFKVKPKAQSYSVDAYYAPGHWFFCRRIEIPSDLERGEEEGFLMLELESLSPFPLEHLYYGFRLDAARRFGFVFAAYKRRFEGVEVGGWRRLDAALPDFLVGLGEQAAGSSPLILATARSLVAFGYDGRSELPCRFRAEARRPGEEGAPPAPDEIAAFRSSLQEAGFGSVEPRILFADAEASWIGPAAWFQARDAAGITAARTSIVRTALWKTDLRDPEMVERAQKDERQNAFMWKGALGLAALVALLLLGELFWGASYGYMALRRQWNAERAPLVAEIDQKQATANTLYNYLESNLLPFQMIESLRPFQGWPSIVYRRLETSGPDTLIIMARAENSSQVTAFRNRLDSFEKIASARLTNQENTAQGSTFTMEIRFVPGAFAEPATQTARNES